ncbi:LysM peptidoglycan-binding domain-containing protein [candidate division WWE3 bacterium]|nr:LysM peptidoglycan-binding domain-containing protein [candidate division WWE3 bacterium]
MNKLLDYLRKIDFKEEKVKDFIAGALALFFLISAGFIAMDKFDKSNKDVLPLGKGGTNGEIVTNDENNKGTTTRDTKTQGLENGGEGETAMVEGAASTRWVANDYVKGDIKNGDYKVVSGDTLWEIAEAVYGDGTQWTKILEANSKDIGFLPNGSQALITVGQVLQIP